MPKPTTEMEKELVKRLLNLRKILSARPQGLMPARQLLSKTRKEVGEALQYAESNPTKFTGGV